MTNHTWVREVLVDLEQYANANGLPDDLVGAIALAAEHAKGKLPIVYKDLAPSRKAKS